MSAQSSFSRKSEAAAKAQLDAAVVLLRIEDVRPHGAL
jgi:hypothetical protein